MITIQVRVKIGEDVFVDRIDGSDIKNAMENAKWNWPGAIIEFIKVS
ncbi:hypothetical protein [Planococcus lenghuensis]|nr:hypothetical protein [Planococcus lenghuensis]